VSKHDSHFFNMFSVVLGILIAIAIGIFVFARAVGVPFEEERRRSDSMIVDDVAARTAPVGREAIAGKDNAALTFVAASADAAAAPVLALPTNAEETFKAVCTACHGAGINGAPKAGDRAAWAPRIAQGKSLLYTHAINGFTSEGGMMPAKGGRTDLPDDLVRQTVDYMIKLAQ
jgi:cytochrome c5